METQGGKRVGRGMVMDVVVVAFLPPFTLSPVLLLLEIARGRG